ncbi:MAG: isochorismatase family protein [Bacteroidales bacterium]
MKQVLLIIDLQNDYFPGYKFPLWNTTDVLHRILLLIDHAKQKNIPVVLIQHVADVSLGFAPFFVPDTEGVEIKKEVLDKFTNPIIVQKAYADGFVKRPKL